MRVPVLTWKRNDAIYTVAMPVLRKKCSLIRLTKIPPVNRLPEPPPSPILQPPRELNTKSNCDGPAQMRDAVRWELQLERHGARGAIEAP